MAKVKVDGKSIKAKVKRTKNPLFADEKHIGGEPVWDHDRALTMSREEFDHHLRNSFRYYNYFYSVKDCRKYVNEWIKTASEFTEEEKRLYLKTSDRHTPMTMCSLVMAHRQGMPINDRMIEFFRECVTNAMRHADDVDIEVEPTVKAVAVPKPTIQDRLNEKMTDVLGEMEGMFDEAMTATKTDHKIYQFLEAQKVPQAQIGKVRSLFQDKFDEFKAAQTGEDSQIKEGYSHLKAADYRRVLAWIEGVFADCDSFEKAKKIQRKSRVKKAPSKEKLVARLKFLKEHKELKLVSINPVDIIGATELWVYNVKTRKLGKYVADSHSQSLAIKGTSLVGFDESKSVSKTLRKPEEKLREFSKASKVQLRRFLEDIKATDTRLNGRLSADVLLLKAQ
jgi:hypothetical protein